MLAFKTHQLAQASINSTHSRRLLPPGHLATRRTGASRNLTSGSGTAAAGKQARRAQRPPPDDEEHTSAVAFLHTDLGFTLEEAHDLGVRSARTACTQALSPTTVQGWVSYLTMLASGDGSVAAAVLHSWPKLLHHEFDDQRQASLEELQHHLQATLGISQPHLLRMAQRCPRLLTTPVPTVQAASAFLLTLGGGDVAALRTALVSNPEPLATTVGTMEDKLRWLTTGLGASPDEALRLLPKIHGSSVADVLEPHRRWLKEQGFTDAEVRRLAFSCPPLLWLSTDLLQRRLHSLSHTFEVPLIAVRGMLVKHPTLWTADLDGRLVRLKLRYWQEELGYSLLELGTVPHVLTYGLDRITRRHSFLRDVLGMAVPPSRFLTALISADDGERANNVGPDFLATFLRQHLASSASAGGAGGSSGSSTAGSARATGGSSPTGSASGVGSISGGGSVQDVLRPLAARLSQAEQQVAWLQALAAAPPMAVTAASTAPQRHLYAALYRIACSDWQLSPGQRKWAGREAEATAADRSRRAGAIKASITAGVQRKSGAVVQQTGAEADDVAAAPEDTEAGAVVAAKPRLRKSRRGRSPRGPLADSGGDA